MWYQVDGLLRDLDWMSMDCCAILGRWTGMGQHVYGLSWDLTDIHGLFKEWMSMDCSMTEYLWTVVVLGIHGLLWYWIPLDCCALPLDWISMGGCFSGYPLAAVRVILDIHWRMYVLLDIHGLLCH